MMLNPRKLIKNKSLVYWYYNVNQEQLWNSSTVFPAVTDNQQLELVKQQEQQLLFIARPEDTVLFRHQPDSQFLSYLEDEGITTLPRIEIVDTIKSFKGLDIPHALFVPYINSREIEYLYQDDPKMEIFGSNNDLVMQLNNKFLTRKLAETNDFKVTRGKFCSNVDELQEAYSSLRNSGFEKCVLKVPYGSSGKGLKVIDSEDAFRILIKFISRRSKEFELLIEGWYPVSQNINCQLWIDEDRTEIMAVTEQIIDSNCVYLGTNYMPNYSPMLLDKYRQDMMRLGNLLRERGYKGICGIDSIIDKEEQLFPIIEINARFTQVTYMLPLVNKISYKFNYIISRYVRFETQNELSFNNINSLLQQKLEPDNENRFIIYTFAKSTLLDKSKTIYRVYVMIYGNHFNKINSMYCGLEQLIFN